MDVILFLSFKTVVACEHDSMYPENLHFKTPIHE